LNKIIKRKDSTNFGDHLSPLSDIIEVLNHESVNLFAEHLIKELGKKFKNNGSTASGAQVIIEFLKNSGIDTNGMFIEDGSGLSPLNAINTRELVRLLVYMKNRESTSPNIIHHYLMPEKTEPSKTILRSSFRFTAQSKKRFNDKGEKLRRIFYNSFW